jgi:hypothetical protein
VGKSTPQNARFTKAQFTRKVSNFNLFFVHEIAARLGVHAVKSRALRPDTAADALARFKYSDTATAPFELTPGGKTGKAGTDNKHSRPRHNSCP